MSERNKMYQRLIEIDYLKELVDLLPGDLIVYRPSLEYVKIKKRIESHGLIIKKCPKNSEEYQDWGKYTCIVKSKRIGCLRCLRKFQSTNLKHNRLCDSCRNSIRNQ